MVVTAEGWGGREAPGLDAIEALAERAFAALPDAVRRLCGHLVVRVADWPEDAALDELGLESAYDLLGLFQGVGLVQGGGETGLATGQMPNAVWLYRRPLLDYWAEHEEALGDLVTHVLVHEIGHHLGLSDDDMEAIEAAAERTA